MKKLLFSKLDKSFVSHKRLIELYAKTFTYILLLFMCYLDKSKTERLILNRDIVINDIFFQTVILIKH